VSCILILVNLSLVSTELKRLVKKLAPVQSDFTVLDPINGKLYSSDISLTVVVEDPLLKALDAEELDGPVCVNSSQFSSIVTKTTGQVSISIVGSRMVIKSKRAVFELATTHPKLVIPVIPPAELTLGLKDVAAVLSFAASASDTKERHEYTGNIKISSETGKLIAIATDKRRLAIADVPTDAAPFELYCPVVLISALRSLEGESVTISQTPSQLFFRTPQVLIVGRKLATKFPIDVNKLFPTTPLFRAEVDAEAMAEGLKQVSPMVVVDEQGHRKMNASFGSSIRLSAISGNSKAQDEVDYNPITPDPMFDPTPFDAILDHRNLSEFFDLVKGKVTVTGTTTVSPMLFTSGNLKFLVNPMRP
jgi:DNA polymerase III sliding clamp (beta) subunit (PCNA family)